MRDMKHPPDGRPFPIPAQGVTLTALGLRPGVAAVRECAMRCCLFLWSLIPLILLGQAVSAAQPSLQAYQRRLEHFRGQIPALIRSADSFAAHAIEHPRALLNVAWRGQPSFSDELMSRAGGLA